ncbi:MAG TPA: hypothetical protein ENN80_06710, partial [Candidatus Hydrogenedentes bacterium]|nr:hypothetical protein [Candidatus Hydrogenedentota bacterium]
GISGKPIFDVAGLDAMVESLRLLESSRHVERVSGIPQVFMDLFGGEDPEAFEDEIMGTPFYKGFFVSDDGSVAGLVVEPGELEGSDAEDAFLADVEAGLAPLRRYGYDVDLVGAMVIGAELKRLSLEESMRFFPVALTVSLVILLALLRSVRAAAMVVLCGASTIVLMLGTVVLSGRPLNVVTSSFPLILWMLCLANCIHLVTRCQFFMGGGCAREDAVTRAVDEVILPCFISAVTTAFGFVSLARSELTPIREFGVLMAVGMVYAFVVNMALGSWLLGMFRVRSPRWVGASDGAHFRRIGAWAMGRPWPVIAAFVGLVLVGVYSLTQVRTEANSLSFLPEDSPVVRSFYKVTKSLTGAQTVEIVVDTPGTWLNPEYWGAIEELRTAIEEMDAVRRVFGPLDYLRKIRQWDQGPDPEAYRLPDSREEAEALVALANDEEDSGFDRLVRADGEQIRMTALLTTADAGDFFELFRRMEEVLARLPAPLSGELTGSAAEAEHITQVLVDSQRKSFSLAFVLVFASMWAGLRSFRLLLVSVVPNIMPILTTFSIMLLLDIPLDAGTVMVASIALGIAVDDTVHILAGYRRHRRAGRANLKA